MSKLNEVEQKLSDTKVTATDLADLILLIDAGTISNNVAKSTILDEMIATGDKPENIIKKLGLTQISDTSEIEDFCKKAMEANPKSCCRY